MATARSKVHSVGGWYSGSRIMHGSTSSDYPRRNFLCYVAARPERHQRGAPNQWASWRDGNWNGKGPRPPTRFERETELISKLIESGRVDDRILLGQGDRIDPINVDILSIANTAASDRRTVLDLKISNKSKYTMVKDIERRLAVSSAEVQHLQGLIEGFRGRSLKIPDFLLCAPIDLKQ